MDQASTPRLHGVIAWPLILVSMAALLLILLGTGSGPYRQLAGVITIAYGGFVLLHQIRRIVTGMQPFTYVPTDSGPTGVEFLTLMASITVLGLGPFWPELNQTTVMRIGVAPLMVGAYYRGYRWLARR
jgi:hypothetical protein